MPIPDSPHAPTPGPLAGDRSDYLTDRYNERKEATEKEDKRLAAMAMSHEVKAAE